MPVKMGTRGVVMAGVRFIHQEPLTPNERYCMSLLHYVYFDRCSRAPWRPNRRRASKAPSLHHLANSHESAESRVQTNQDLHNSASCPMPQLYLANACHLLSKNTFYLPGDGLEYFGGRSLAVRPVLELVQAKPEMR